MKDNDTLTLAGYCLWVIIIMGCIWLTAKCVPGDLDVRDPAAGTHIPDYVNGDRGVLRK